MYLSIINGVTGAMKFGVKGGACENRGKEEGKMAQEGMSQELSHKMSEWRRANRSATLTEIEEAVAVKPRLIPGGGGIFDVVADGFLEFWIQEGSTDLKVSINDESIVPYSIEKNRYLIKVKICLII